MSDGHILPDDRYRCFDHECPQREKCVRYVQRERSHNPDRVVAADSLRGGRERCDVYLAIVPGDWLPDDHPMKGGPE